MLTPVQARSLLGGMRLVIGLGGLVAPAVGARLFGMDPARNPALPYFTRLFAVRDAALGAGLLLADARDRGRWVDLGIASDVSDVGAALAAGRKGQLTRGSAVMAAGAALVAVALGLRSRGGEG